MVLCEHGTAIWTLNGGLDEAEPRVYSGFNMAHCVVARPET
jgi:hypothetical protein